MLSKNVKIMLLVLVLGLTYVFILGCDDTASGVNYDTAKSAVRAIESSDIGVTLTTIGEDVSDKVGESNISGDLLKGVQNFCQQKGYNADCTDKE